MDESPPSRSPGPEDPTMPKPVPIPVRRKLLQRARQGESTASLAAAFGLAPRTVRHLRKRFLDRGPEGVSPDYRAPRGLPHAYPDQVREAALALRRQHPTWGAVLIRVALRARRPKIAWPSPSTLRRWFHDAGLGPAPPPQRPRPQSKRATAPHQTWQIDASERIPLAHGSQVCWLRVVDEATGAVLGTVIFPPSLLEPGRSPRHPGGPAGAVRPLGPARAAEDRQRDALGLARRPADRLGVLAGGPGCGPADQPPASAASQRHDRALAGGGQVVGGAAQVRLGGRVAAAPGRTGPLAAGSVPDGRWAPAPRGLPRVEAFGAALRGGPRGGDLGPAAGLGVGGVAPGPPTGGLARQGLAVQPGILRGVDVEWPDDLGGVRPRARRVDVPGRGGPRDPSSGRVRIERGADRGADGDPSSSRLPCGKTS